MAVPHLPRSVPVQRDRECTCPGTQYCGHANEIGILLQHSGKPGMTDKNYMVRIIVVGEVGTHAQLVSCQLCLGSSK